MRNVSYLKRVGFLLILGLGVGGTASAVRADVDVSPWQNPAGFNMGINPDITFSGPVQDGVPIQVSVDVFNRGNMALDTSVDPVTVRIQGNAGNITTDADVTGDTKTISGSVIASGAFATVIFTWTPLVADGASQIFVFIDQSNDIVESDETNNFTLRDFAFANPTPELICHGYNSPFDQPLALKKKSKRTIPVKLELVDEDGFIVTDLDIVASPVITVLYNGAVIGEVPPDDGDLLPNGSANDDNVFRFDSDSSQWIYNLGTKQFKAPGTYTVMVASGDTSEYTINSPNGACVQTFERLP